MNRAFRLRCCAALVALAATGARAGEDALRFEEGVARNPSTSTVMYREQHWTRRQADKLVERLVLYRCPDGTAFARKRVDYRGSAISPAFAFEDRRSGHREGLRRNARPTLFFQAPGQSGERLAAMKSGSFVADAGFDEFVRRQWSALVAGRSMPLDFALPSRLRSLPFSVRRQGEAVIAGEKAWVFRLKLQHSYKFLIREKCVDATGVNKVTSLSLFVTSQICNMLRFKKKLNRKIKNSCSEKTDDVNAVSPIP